MPLSTRVTGRVAAGLTAAGYSNAQIDALGVRAGEAVADRLLQRMMPAPLAAGGGVAPLPNADVVSVYEAIDNLCGGTGFSAGVGGAAVETALGAWRGTPMQFVGCVTALAGAAYQMSATQALALIRAFVAEPGADVVRTLTALSAGAPRRTQLQDLLHRCLTHASAITAADVVRLQGALAALTNAEQYTIFNLATSTLGGSTPLQMRNAVDACLVASGTVNAMTVQNLNTLVGRFPGANGALATRFLSTFGPASLSIAGHFPAATAAELAAFADRMAGFGATHAELLALSVALNAINATVAQATAIVRGLTPAIAPAPAAGAAQLTTAHVVVLATAPTAPADLVAAVAGTHGGVPFAHHVLNAFNDAVNPAHLLAFLREAWSRLGTGLSANMVCQLMAMRRTNAWAFNDLRRFVAEIHGWGARVALDWQGVIGHLTHFVTDRAARDVINPANLNQETPPGWAILRVRLTQAGLTHIVQGHTYMHFLFTRANINRNIAAGLANGIPSAAASLTFWPAGTSAANIRTEVGTKFASICTSHDAGWTAERTTARGLGAGAGTVIDREQRRMRLETSGGHKVVTQYYIRGHGGVDINCRVLYAIGMVLVSLA